VRTGVVPSGLALSSHPTRHLRAGLSHAAASRLDFGGAGSTVFPEIRFSRTLFSPRGTGSNRITPAADEYGYASARAANLALTGFIRMYST
jgi:hypothetical protein